MINSLKLPDALKDTIAKVAALEGKTAHALMVDTLQSAMDDALARQQFYADGETAYLETLQSNRAYAAADVKAYLLARASGARPAAPTSVAFDTSKPISPE
jgi:hypothetical protein